MVKKLIFTVTISLLAIYLSGVIITESINPLDIAKSLKVRAMGISPNVPFYETTRYEVGHIFQPLHNYPAYAPITLEQAENAPYRRNSPTTEIKITTVGDNYQIKERWNYRRKPQYILLNEEQLVSLKSIENGNHFFVLDDNLRLQPVTIEEAIMLPNYIKVVKEMGKIISIEKKPLVSIFKQEYQYRALSGERQFFKKIHYSIDKKSIFSSLFSEYNENGKVLYYITRDAKDNVISKEIINPEGSKYYSETTLFNAQGEKTNIIYNAINGKNKSEHLDQNGNILEVTYENDQFIGCPDFEEDERYQTLKIDSSKKYNIVDNLDPET
ncbi:hypothetical protein [Snodgrassella communis]|uniref:hypothetical protein n=1 Tax=Snodgrassella communis TaxID=2946699 RepID=UPI001EF51548|nr:hypothetical protein [Snodgrassella communis]